MPKSAIEAPATASTVDRLALGSEVIRGAGASSNPSTGCYCSCACFDAEPATYAAGCAACCCFETE
jgi:hypothetical protein